MRKETPMSARKKLEIKGKSTVSKIMIPSVDKLINHTKVLQKKKNQVMKILFCLNQLNKQLKTSTNKINTIKSIQDKMLNPDSEDKTYTIDEIGEIIQTYNQCVNKVNSSYKEQYTYTNSLYELKIRTLIAETILNKNNPPKKENEEINVTESSRIRKRRGKSVDNNETDVSSVITHNSSVGNYQLSHKSRASFKKVKALSVDNSKVNLKLSSDKKKRDDVNNSFALKKAEKFCSNYKERRSNEKVNISLEEEKMHTNHSIEKKKAVQKRASKSIEKIKTEEVKKKTPQQIAKQKKIEEEQEKMKQKLKILKCLQIVTKIVKIHLKQEEIIFFTNFKNKNKQIIKEKKKQQRNLILAKAKNGTRIRKFFRRVIVHYIGFVMTNSSSDYVKKIKQKKQEKLQLKPIKKQIPKTLTKPNMTNKQEKNNIIAPNSSRSKPIPKKSNTKSDIKGTKAVKPKIKKEVKSKVKEELKSPEENISLKQDNDETINEYTEPNNEVLNKDNDTITNIIKNEENDLKEELIVEHTDNLQKDIPINNENLPKQIENQKEIEETNNKVLPKEEVIKTEEFPKEELKEKKPSEPIKEIEKISSQKSINIKDEAKPEPKNEDKSMDLVVEDDISQLIQDNDFIMDDEDENPMKEDTDDNYEAKLQKLKNITQETKDIESNMKQFIDKIQKPEDKLILVNS